MGRQMGVYYRTDLCTILAEGVPTARSRGPRRTPSAAIGKVPRRRVYGRLRTRRRRRRSPSACTEKKSSTDHAATQPGGEKGRHRGDFTVVFFLRATRVSAQGPTPLPEQHSSSSPLLVNLVLISTSVVLVILAMKKPRQAPDCRDFRSGPAGLGPGRH